MHTCYLLLGTNLGDKSANLEEAIRHISERIGKVITLSSKYRTAAWGIRNQGDFFNQVVKVETDLEPETLLQVCLQIEKDMGRVRYQKWGERLIDVDILYYNDQIIESRQLNIPHPEIQNRRFTLVPLAEIAEDIVHPVLRINHEEMLRNCDDSLEVEAIAD